MRRTGRYEKKKPVRKKRGIWFVLPILVLLIGAACVCFLRQPEESGALPGNETRPTGPVEKNASSIAIPGYEGVSLMADTKKQSVCFQNPAQNVCYFQLTLSLEDGAVLWQSNLVEPGELSEKVMLSMPLKAGTYPNAKLTYACFTFDEAKAPLNGAETKLTLWVK